MPTLVTTILICGFCIQSQLSQTHLQCNFNQTWSLNALQYNSDFGKSLAAADVDNDGVIDILIGSPAYTVSSGDEGKVYLYLGTNTVPIWSYEGTYLYIEGT